MEKDPYRFDLHFIIIKKKFLNDTINFTKLEALLSNLFMLVHVDDNLDK